MPVAFCLVIQQCMYVCMYGSVLLIRNAYTSIHSHMYKHTFSDAWKPVCSYVCARFILSNDAINQSSARCLFRHQYVALCVAKGVETDYKIATSQGRCFWRMVGMIPYGLGDLLRLEKSNFTCRLVFSKSYVDWTASVVCMTGVIDDFAVRPHYFSTFKNTDVHQS